MRPPETWVSRVRVAQGLRQWDTFRPPVAEGQPLKWAQRPVLHTGVVNMWRNQAADPDGGRGYVTNAPSTAPWPVVDGYDDRSWLENGLFRNSQQFWRLPRWFPQQTAAGVQSHLPFVVMMLAVATAYRLWDKAQAGALAAAPDYQIAQVGHKIIGAQTGAVSIVPEPKPSRRTHLATRFKEEAAAPPAKPTSPACSHEQLEGRGPLRWRRHLQRANRDKGIVLIGHLYGIFHTCELLVLADVPVRELPPHLGSRDDILRRYGCLSDA